MLMPTRISARKILNIDIEILWEYLAGEFTLVFDDGEIHTNAKETLISWYAWEYHRKFNLTPLSTRHHLATTLKGKPWNASSHLELINSVLWDSYDHHVSTYARKTELTDELSKLAYEVTNNLYNVLSYRLEEYVVGLDIIDFIAISRHGRVEEARKLLSDEPESIDHLHSTIMEVVRKSPDMVNNPLAKVLRAGLTRQGQALQVLGVRGYVTDIDQIRFTKPILRGFLQGIVSLVDSMQESRSASISLKSSGPQLETSEYFSRRQQLICMYVKNIHRVDCGSTNYLTTTLLPAGFRDGKYFDNDLDTWCGKYYINEETGVLQSLSKNDTHLLGKTMRFRSPVAGCKHPDPYGICEVCFGSLADSLPEGTNLGHISCVTLTSDLGQMILSTKHHMSSSHVDGITLKPADRTFLHVQSNRNLYYMAPALKGKAITLLFPAASLMGIADIAIVDDVENLSETRVSLVNTMGFSVANEDGMDITSVQVSADGRMASLSHALLAHIKTNGYRVNKQDQYEVDMDDWDWSQPILSIPMRQHSTGDLQVAIAKLLESTKEKMEERSERTNPVNTLMDFYNLVNKTMKVNIAVLEVILYSSMVVSTLGNE